MLANKLHSPGEYPFNFIAGAGQVEGILTVPPQVKTDYLAVLGHPHSLQGGTMNNKVVTTLARAFKELGIPSLRFNFRGVGNSEGKFDAGFGESEDMLLLMKLCQQEKPQSRFIVAGFSFGSYVAYRTAVAANVDLLVTVAPPVHHFNYKEFTPVYPWIIMQGDEDEIVPLSQVLTFANSFHPFLPVYRFAETSHFFHGKLLELKAKLIEVVSQKVSLS